MHIVFPAIALNSSGGVRVTIQYLNGLVKSAHRVTVVVPANVGESYYPLDKRIETVRTSRNAIKSQWEYPFLAWSLSRAVPCCDVIMANGWQTMYAAWFARRRSKRGLIVLVHDVRVLAEGLLGHGSTILKLRALVAARLAFQMPATRVAVSGWTAKRLSKRFGYDCIESPNGVDNIFFHPVQVSASNGSANKQVLVMGQRAPWKGYQDALEAIRIARRSDSDIRLLLVNRDNIAVPSDIPHTSIAPRSDEDLRACYCASNVFLFSSHFEGFGLPPLEAMACGVPVVVTDCGGVGEYAIHDSNCLMVPIKRPEEMAAAILRLVHNAKLRNQLTNEGLKTAARYSLADAQERFSKIVEAV